MALISPLLNSLLYSPAEPHGVISTQRPQEFATSVAVYWWNWAEVINDTGSSLVVLQNIYAIIIRPKYLALSDALGMRIKQSVHLLSHSWHDCVCLSLCCLYPHVSLCRCWSGHSCYLLRFLHILQCAHELGTLLFIQLLWNGDPALEVLQQHLECCWKLFERLSWQWNPPAVC